MQLHHLERSATMPPDGVCSALSHVIGHSTTGRAGHSQSANDALLVGGIAVDAGSPFGGDDADGRVSDSPVIRRPGYASLTKSEISERSYDLGWDMAHYGIAPRDSWPYIQQNIDLGFSDGREHFGQRTLPTTAYIKKWLRLRGGALNRGKICHESITPAYLAKIAPEYCPIRRTRLCYDGSFFDRETQRDLIWSVDRLNNDGGYIEGNVLVMSETANKAKSHYGYAQVKEIYDSLRESNETHYESLSLLEWGRMLALSSMTVQNDANWKEVAKMPVYLRPPKFIYMQGAIWVVLLHFTELPFKLKNRPAVQKWASYFKTKTLRKAATDCMIAYITACSKLATAPKGRNGWILEDAWMDRGFQYFWSRFVDRLELQDLDFIAGITGRIDPDEYQQWKLDAGMEFA